MKRIHHIVLSIIFLLSLCITVTAQDAVDISSVEISPKLFKDISDKAGNLEYKLQRRAAKALLKFQRNQNKLKRKLYKIDSLSANTIFNTAEQRFRKLQDEMKSPKKFTQYIPFLDTLKTSLKFIEQNRGMIVHAKGASSQLNESLAKINGLENQLQKAEDIRQFLKQQRRLLKEELERFGFAKQLKKLNKDVYYYGEQVKEYKTIISDKKRRERKAIELLSKTRPFQDFMKKNSMLSTLFRMPVEDQADPAYLQSLAGLQTRVQVNQLIQQQIAAGGPNALQQVQNNIQQAQSELQQLKDKIKSKGGSDSHDEDAPDFRPNDQKVKSFLKRLEVGSNMQTQKSNWFFPVTSDIGLSLGYKLSDKSIIGVGASYKIGWGKSFRQIRMTHEGAGLRSFVDYNIRKTFWLSGGIEMNYRADINSIEQLKHLNAWQQSGLVGFSKKLSVDTKFFKSTKMQLLWDFLSYRQMPRSQPIVFRIGYAFK